MQKKQISNILGIIKWSIIRHKYLIPAFTIIQIVFAVAIVVGLSIFLPELDETTTVYLSSGAITLGMIAVGCVLAPQIVSETKQNGVLKYQLTLPVPRISILLADILIWGATAIPGIIGSFVAAVLRFGVSPKLSLSGIGVITIALISLICIGFCIAYWLPPNAVPLATQVIMFGGLLFSPIIYPASRLPEWSEYIYKAMPFVPVSNLIRNIFFQAGSIPIVDTITVIAWGSMAFVLAFIFLEQRQ